MSEHDDHSQDYSSSLADLMASVAAVFLIVAGVYIFQINKAKADSKDEISKSRDELYKEIAKVLEITIKGSNNRAENDCAVLDKSEDGKITVRFREPESLTSSCVGLNFTSGSDLLSEVQTSFVRNRLSKVFKSICTEFTRSASVSEVKVSPIKSVALVGHTDNSVSRIERENLQRHMSKYDEADVSLLSNLPLSSRRAQAVYMNARSELSSSSSSTVECLDTLFSVSGKGPTEPLVELTDGNRENGEWISGQFKPSTQKDILLQQRANRRVELVILFSDDQKKQASK
ncbi:MAG: hypothetical protein EOP06_09400 [Proteobacteria bacterium]|nr:MAG: hypothetical protein EOP06_09400 [Pseudomonadota bacterium]